MKTHSWRWARPIERREFPGMGVKICRKCGLLHAYVPGIHGRLAPNVWRMGKHKLPHTLRTVPIPCEPPLDFQI